MNTCYRSAANVVLCSLLLTLFSSVAVAQSDSAPVMSSDAVKPERRSRPNRRTRRQSARWATPGEIRRSPRAN